MKSFRHIGFSATQGWTLVNLIHLNQTTCLRWLRVPKNSAIVLAWQRHPFSSKKQLMGLATNQAKSLCHMVAPISIGNAVDSTAIAISLLFPVFNNSRTQLHKSPSECSSSSIILLTKSMSYKPNRDSMILSDPSSALTSPM